MRRLLLLFLVVAACKREGGRDKVTSASPAVSASVTVGADGAPSDFDLEATAELVRRGRVRNGKDLERQLNEGGVSRADRDGDGKGDPIRVVERRDGDDREFHVEIVPSSKRRSDLDEVAIPTAVIVVSPLAEEAHVIVRWADEVHVDTIIAFEMPIVVDTFCHWVLFVERPLFVGLAYVIIIEVEVDHHHHKKHKKHKHKKH